jgi:hypothetical protein
MTKTVETLYALWQSAHHQSAWLSSLVERFALDAEDEAYLNDTDDVFRHAIKDIHDQWRRDFANRIRQFRNEVDSKWAKKRRKEYLVARLQTLDARIADLTHGAQDAQSLPADFTLLVSVLQDVKQAHRRLSGELRALQSKSKGNRLTEEQIERARSRPLEEILSEEPIRGYITCPMHEERTGHPDAHPSMLVRKGFGYCFSCSDHLDSIGYLMRVRGLRFREAVEALQ